MSGKAIDEIGNRYGKLVVIRRAGTKAKYATWLCRCDCGGEKVVSGAYLRRAYTASCGCAKNALPKGEAAFNSMYSKMKRAASRRGYEWQLSKEEVKRITSSPCHYCGCAPAQRGSRGHPGLNGEYYFNGLDRVDNAISYVMSNVVPCCKNCNYAKRAMSQSEFYDWIEKVYAHIQG